jgi:hypothetical protein
MSMRGATLRTAVVLAVLVSTVVLMLETSYGPSARAGALSHTLLLPDDNTVFDNVATGETTLTDSGTNSSPTFAAFDNGSASALYGVSTSGSGVDGQGSYGVYGHSVIVGVYGWSESGTAIRAQTVDGTALDVLGRAVFSRSGLVSIPAGQTQAKVTGVALTSSSLVFAMVQQVAGNRFVRAAVPDVGSSSFTVYLNRPANVTISVAWFLVN